MPEQTAFPSGHFTLEPAKHLFSGSHPVLAGPCASSSSSSDSSGVGSSSTCSSSSSSSVTSSCSTCSCSRSSPSSAPSKSFSAASPEGSWSSDALSHGPKSLNLGSLCSSLGGSTGAWTVQSPTFSFFQQTAEFGAEGHGEPSGQQSDPAQCRFELGQGTDCPTSQNSGSFKGFGALSPVQSCAFGFWHFDPELGAEGHSEPSGQHWLSLQKSSELGHRTVLPGLHWPFGCSLSSSFSFSSAGLSPSVPLQATFFGCLQILLE
mmetsp:Transcript_53623/g.74354  ORF Transcript_53623/g.74354 Transcript_53623/m.74354 type:complete len:263 (+) Transcript_53623:615-1403(+)